MSEDWLDRWEKRNIGWHEATGNRHLRRWWRFGGSHHRVLVPLCGKSLDLVWLAEHGHAVTGIELSPVAVEAFFDENGFEFDRDDSGPLPRYRARQESIEIYVGDYFAFDHAPFDALFDRGALIALPETRRPDYVEHTRSLLDAGAAQILITLSYDQAKVAGPPFSVPPSEVERYWPKLHPVEAFNAIDESPPKFRSGGLRVVTETIWRTA